MAKSFILEVSVPNADLYLDHPESHVYDENYAEDQIADMLRYDVGQILSKKREGNEVIFQVKCKHYTEARWRSFGLKTRVLRRE